MINKSSQILLWGTAMYHLYHVIEPGVSSPVFISGICSFHTNMLLEGYKNVPWETRRQPSGIFPNWHWGLEVEGAQKC